MTNELKTALELLVACAPPEWEAELSVESDGFTMKLGHFQWEPRNIPSFWLDGLNEASDSELAALSAFLRAEIAKRKDFVVTLDIYWNASAPRAAIDVALYEDDLYRAPLYKEQFPYTPEAELIHTIRAFAKVMEQVQK